MKRVMIAGIMLCLLLAGKVEAQEIEKAYDGVWWQASPKEERVGFLAGYIDCAAYDAGKKYLLDISWDSLEPEISKNFEDHPSELHSQVATLIVGLSRQKHHAIARGGEAYREKHGIFDGEYWRRASAEHRIGYLEGYLVCQREAGKAFPSFPQGPKWYGERISHWYGVREDDPSEINTKRANKKIADVLYIFKAK